MRNRKPVLVGEILRGTAAAGWLGGGLEAAEVLAAWEAVAGRLAAICRPEGFRAGELRLAGLSAPAAQEVGLRRETIRRKINRHLGREAVHAVRVAHRAGRWPDEDSASPARNQAVAAEPILDPEEVERIEQEIAAIADDAARDGARRMLLRAAKVSAARLAMGWQPCSVCGTLTDPGQGALCPFCHPNYGG